MSAARARTGASPWCRADVLSTALLVALGCVVWTIGWYRVSGRTAMDQQVAPFDLAVFGVVVAAAGQVRWFRGGRRAVEARRRVLLGLDAAPVASVPVAPAEVFSGSERFFHRAECPMAVDRAWPAAPRSTHERAGRVPCGVCAP